MTDARMPERWLNDIRFRKLSDPEFRTYVVTLMWSVANRTNGTLMADELEFIPDVAEDHSRRLVELNLWSAVPGGWMIRDFEATQTSKEQLEGLELKRRQDAVRARTYRDRKKAGSRDSSRDSSRDDRGQDRQGQDRQAFNTEYLTEAQKDHVWSVGLNPAHDQDVRSNRR